MAKTTENVEQPIVNPNPVEVAAEAPSGKVKVKGRLGTTQRAESKGLFNMLITDPAAIAAIEKIGQFKGFNPKNPKGEIWAQVSLDAKGKLTVKRAANGARMVSAEGIFTYSEFVYGIRGHLVITNAELLDGVKDDTSRVQGREDQLLVG